MDLSILATTAVSANRTPWFVLGGGTLLLSMTLLYFIMSRRGATKSVSKCVLLSIWAHIILLGCAYLTNWFPAPNGLPLGHGEVRVRWVGEATDDAADDRADDPTNQDAAPQWDQHDRATLDESLETLETPSPDQKSVTVEPDPATDDAQSVEPPDQVPAEPADAAPPAIVVMADESRGDASAESTSQSADDSTAEEQLDSAAPVSTATSADEWLSPDAEAEAVFSSTNDAQPKGADVNVADVAPPDSAPHAAPSLQDSPLPPAAVETSSSALPERYRGRTAENRRKLAEAQGGSLDTEAAVEAALKWLAQAQQPQDGRWDNRAWEGGRETRELAGVSYGVRADTAVTGLALLSFLGAGHTHEQGPYREQVRRGLEFLLHSQSSQSGSLAGDASRYVAMYCHGIATLAISEASIMTNDPRLRGPLQRAVDYTVRTQHPITGGWRYQPGDLGDTSQFGWQLVALVSGDAAGLPIPDETWRGAQRWLNRVALGNAGGLACYTPDRLVASPSMTAEALFCRTFLPGAPRTAAIEEAADFVSRYGERPEAVRDFYFCYYATLALYPLQDERWQRWNRTLTEHLVTHQRSGGSLAGSWDPDTTWGPTGGRVYTTSMACLCLETYYRYLPVYELASSRGRAMRRR